MASKDSSNNRNGHCAFNSMVEGKDSSREKGLARWRAGEGTSHSTNEGTALAIPAQQRQVDARKAWYRCQLGRAFWALGRVQEALEHFEKACELMPHEPYYRLELAEAYLSLKRYDEAIAQLEQTISWAPYDDYYHVRLAAAYLLVGRLDDAIATLEKAIKLSPLNASYHCLLGALYLMRGDEERASFHLRFRWQLDQYDRSFLRQFQKLCGGRLELPQGH